MKVYVRVTDDKNQAYEGTVVLTKAKKQKIHKQIKIKIRGPTDIIKQLYYQNYFENKRTLNDVEKNLKLKKYNFSKTGIDSALNRTKFLRRSGKMGSYSYIQKIPPN